MVLEVRDTLLESAIERLADAPDAGRSSSTPPCSTGCSSWTRWRSPARSSSVRSQPTRWAVTTVDELGDNIRSCCSASWASGVPCVDEDRLRLAAAVIYVEATNAPAATPCACSGTWSVTSRG